MSDGERNPIHITLFAILPRPLFSSPSIGNFSFCVVLNCKLLSLLLQICGPPACSCPLSYKMHISKPVLSEIVSNEHYTPVPCSSPFCQCHRQVLSFSFCLVQFFTLSVLLERSPVVLLGPCSSPSFPNDLCHSISSDFSSCYHTYRA